MKSNIDYLRAELSAAQSSGEVKAYVRIPELQAVLHRIAQLEKDSEVAKKGKPKLAGYIIGDHLRNIQEGSTMFAKIKRKPTGNFSTALYFLDIEGNDGRETHRIETIEKKRQAKEASTK